MSFFFKNWDFILSDTGKQLEEELSREYHDLIYLFVIFKYFISVFKKYLFGWARSSLQHAESFSWSMQNLVPWPGIKPRPVLRAPRLSHWTTKEVLLYISFFFFFNWRLIYNIVVVFAIHSHESAMAIHLHIFLCYDFVVIQKRNLV